MIAALARYVPRSVTNRVKRALRSTYPFHCPLCGLYAGAFEPFGNPPRPHALCPYCGSLERDRLTTRWIGRYSQARGRVLHIAPESSLAPFLGTRARFYASVDLGLDERQPMVKSDLTRLAFRSSQFDFLYCSHVLEHVPDDRAAMRECLRVLAPTGIATFQVPMRGTRTYEDWSLVTPEQRLAAFGQRDHVRMYGSDFVERLASAGFIVDTITPEALSGGVHVINATWAEPIFVCRRGV
jgi:SAM-dependent methyltransferase